MRRNPALSARKYEQAETDGERMHVGQKLHASIITARASASTYSALVYISLD
jgi:hypothetical protein